MIRSILMATLILISLTGCDQSSDNASSSGKADLAQFVGLSDGKSTSGPQPKIVQAQAPVEQSGQPVVPAPTQPKIYTFQGNVLLPPNAYMNNQNGSINQMDVCGNQTPAQSNGEKYCYKFSELSNRLYDADHSGLDVWDVRGDWLLMLTKAEKDQNPHELWVEKSKLGVYHPYADIMQQKLLFLGDWSYQKQPEWPLQAYDGPDGQPIELKKENYPATKSSSPMVMITSVAQSSKKELWFKLNLINSLCENTSGTNNMAPSPVVMNLWYPAYRIENNLRVPTVWFSAKGC